MKDAQPNGRYSHRFWQRGGGYDGNLWSIDNIRVKIKYIHENPVRRKLVTSPSDWPRSSYNAREIGDGHTLRIDRDSLEQAFP